jgi:hypothetical protein
MDPVERLGYWLQKKEIEPQREAGVSADLMDLFMELNGVLADADTVIDRHRKSTTALARATLAKEAVSAQLRIQDSMGQLQRTKAETLERFPEFEASAEGNHYRDALEALSRLRFLRKWEQQCQQRLLALMEF